MSIDSAREGVIFPSCGHFMLRHDLNKQTEKGCFMDDYQEELLEYQAFELDPLEPADDATEL
ncbi:hypothetical protein [Pseudomonas bubulae]|uniref:hypothetical protein n=1 Tax=Pseudomonas bubulae TaxID=2316085 RepID=UPI0039A3C415